MKMEPGASGYMWATLTVWNIITETWSSLALKVVEGDENGTRCVGVCVGHPDSVEHNYRDLVLQGGGLDTRLTTLICKKIIIIAKSKEVKTRWSN
jgi:hypothetical protein